MQTVNVRGMMHGLTMGTCMMRDRYRRSMHEDDDADTQRDDADSMQRRKVKA